MGRLHATSIVYTHMSLRTSFFLYSIFFSYMILLISFLSTFFFSLLILIPLFLLLLPSLLCFLFLSLIFRVFLLRLLRRLAFFLLCFLFFLYYVTLFHKYAEQSGSAATWRTEILQVVQRRVTKMSPPLRAQPCEE